MDKKGTFVAVSTGMLLGGHITIRSKKLLENADIVFSLVSHPVVETWLRTCNNNVISLQPLYAEGKHRMDTYKEMVELMLEAVREGKNVCGAFYGHAGVFAWVPHRAVEVANEEGYRAYMEPGVSAEACIYSDLGIDPGKVGMQSYEASQFLFYGHTPNTQSYLLLWQIALAGETTAKTFYVDTNNIQIIVEHLQNWYPAEHEVIIYETPTLPIEGVREDRVPLNQLSHQQLNLHSTLIVPPATELTLNERLLRKFNIDKSALL